MTDETNTLPGYPVRLTVHFSDGSEDVVVCGPLVKFSTGSIGVNISGKATGKFSPALDEAMDESGEKVSKDGKPTFQVSGNLVVVNSKDEGDQGENEKGTPAQFPGRAAAIREAFGDPQPKPEKAAKGSKPAPKPATAAKPGARK